MEHEGIILEALNDYKKGKNNEDKIEEINNAISAIEQPKMLTGHINQPIQFPALEKINQDGQEEIDGTEFKISTLQELIDKITQLKDNQGLHITYFQGEADLDIWLKV